MLVVTFHVLSLNEARNRLFDLAVFDLEPRSDLARDLHQQLGMLDRLSRLHDSHDRQLQVRRPVCQDAFGRRLVFFDRLALLDLVDPDPYVVVLEFRVEHERVAVFDFATFRLLLQDAHFAACQAL